MNIVEVRRGVSAAGCDEGFGGSGGGPGTSISAAASLQPAGRKEYDETLEYKHSNPVRRGFVTHPGEWKWASYAEYAIAEEKVQPNPILRIDRVRLPVGAKARS
ncbi:MAG: hypothetical protein ACRD3D_02285 [Terriglobia bacterium]